MGTVADILPLRDGRAIVGADIDQNYARLATVLGHNNGGATAGNLTAVNFSPRAGFGLANRATQGNRLFFSGTQGTTGVIADAAAAQNSPPLVTVSLSALPSGYAGFKLVHIGGVFGSSSNAATRLVQYRLIDARASSGTVTGLVSTRWGAWTNGPTLVTADIPVVQARTEILGPNDYSHLQLRFQHTDTGDAATSGTEDVVVWAYLEALHLP